MTSRIDLQATGDHYLADVGDEQQHVSSSQAEIDHIPDLGKMVTGRATPPDGAQYWHGGNGLHPKGWYRLDTDGWMFHDRHGSTWTPAEPPPPHEMQRIMPRADHIGEATEKPSMAELYPKYYKDFTGVDEADVYLVHDRFQINDPSGCIHHASKKLLLCGVRTGGKPEWQEIKEARDTLTRKLQLMGVE